MGIKRFQTGPSFDKHLASAVLTLAAKLHSVVGHGIGSIPAGDRNVGSNKEKTVMKAKLAIALVVGLWLAAGGAMAASYQDPAVEYSADQHMSAEGYQTMAKVFHAHQKLRMEMQGSVNITRMDKKVIWILMPQMSSYQEHSLSDPRFGAKTPDAGGGNVEMTPLGKETVNGVETTKNKVVSTDPQGHKVEGTMWISKEGIMVKGIFTDPSQGNKPVTIDLKNLKIAKQDPGLFEIPKGYKKMAGFGMGGMMPAGAGQGAMPTVPPGQIPKAGQDPDDEAEAGNPPAGTDDQTAKALKEGMDSLNKLKGILGK